MVADCLSHLWPHHKWKLTPAMFCCLGQCWDPHTINRTALPTSPLQLLVLRSPQCTSQPWPGTSAANLESYWSPYATSTGGGQPTGSLAAQPSRLVISSGQPAEQRPFCFHMEVLCQQLMLVQGCLDNDISFPPEQNETVGAIASFLKLATQSSQ